MQFLDLIQEGNISQMETVEKIQQDHPHEP
jgi:DNA-directed RNA polymerase sigma subunit (sigma70/sigma32)